MRWRLMCAGLAVGSLVAVAAVPQSGAGARPGGSATPAALPLSIAGRHHTHSRKPRRNPRVHVLRAGGGLRKFVEKLGPGDVGELAPGDYGEGTTLNFDHAGTAAKPIRITSLDPAHPARILARVVFKPGGNFWILDHLALDATGGDVDAASVAVAADNITLRHDDITNENKSICINTLSDSRWGTARHTVIDANRIHGCGAQPVTSASSEGYFSHGVYAAGYDAVITNNWIYGNSGRGVQLRGSHGAIVMHNVIDRNGAGVSFGDLDASDNLVAHNIITNSGNAGKVNSFGIFSWWGGSPVGTGNVARLNCFYGNQNGAVADQAGGFTNSNEIETDPKFLARTIGDYRLRPKSPCRGAAPRKTPGI